VLGSGVGARVGGVVALCSPLGFPRGLDVAPFFRPLLPLSALTPGLFGGSLGKLLSPFFLRVDTPYVDHWMVLEHIDAKLVRRLMYRAVQDVPRGLMHQFQDWLENDVIRSKDQAIDYRARLHGCRTPVLVVEAPADGLADVLAVRRALSLLPNADHWIAGKASGCVADYGHVDVVFGRTAPADVHPRLVEWLGKLEARVVLRAAA
jgi:pimeloyl-ACP methyl ester carboxylesterase